MTFNWFLETGKLRVPRGSKYDKRGHRGPPDYDEAGMSLDGSTYTVGGKEYFMPYV